MAGGIFSVGMFPLATDIMKKYQVSNDISPTMTDNVTVTAVVFSQFPYSVAEAGILYFSRNNSRKANGGK